MPPKQFHTLFEPSVPASLIECIADLLKYEPNARLTSEQCMNHRYLCETAPPPPPSPTTSRPPAPTNGSLSRHYVPNRGDTNLPSIEPRTIPPSNSYQSPALTFRSPPRIYADIGSPSSPGSVSPSPLSPQIATASPTLQPPRSSTTSHLVDQLRGLDLPTDELSAYGQRNPRAGRHSPPRHPGPDQWTQDRQHRRQDHQHLPEGLPYFPSIPRGT
jgi:meiosis induction protein kinase IME2/SME1